MSLVVSLFCPACQDLYDETTKRPRHGTCRHSVCHECIVTSGSTKCPICDLKDAFKNVDYNFQLETTLQTFQQLTIEELQKPASNPKKLNIGKCNSPSCDATERLRMCVTCGETSKLFQKQPNGKFQIIEENKLVFLSKAALYCSDCMADGLPDHTGHQFLPFSKIDAIDVDLEFWYYIVHAILVHNKINKERCEASKDSDILRAIVLCFKQKAVTYETHMKSDGLAYLKLLDVIKFSRLKNSVDIYSISELAEAKEKTVKKAKEVIDRIWKVQERKLWIKKKELKNFVEFFEAVELSAKNPDWKNFMDEITSLSNQYNGFKITNLSNSEATYIDQKIDGKMTKAVQKLGLPKDTPQKFLNFKALYNILQEAYDNRDKAFEELLEEAARFEDFYVHRMGKLMNIINKESEEAKLKLRLFLYEVTENSFAMDHLLLSLLEAVNEYEEGHLLWVRNFPTTSDDKSEEYAYNTLLEERFPSDDAGCPIDLFSTSLFT